MSKISQEVVELFYKILIPTLAGLSVRIGVMIKNKEATFINLIGGVFTAVGCSIAFSHILIEKLPYHYASAMIAIMVMLSEKLAVFLLEKFNVEKFFSEIVTSYLSKFKKP